MKDKTAQRDSVALKPLSETAVSLPLSGIRKFFDLASSMEDVISLGVGEPDFQTPWVGRETAIYSIERGQTTYSANQGLIELRQEIDRRYQRLYNLSFDPKTEILVTVGASQALDLACRAILNPGDEVLLPEPCFVAYKPIVLLAGGKPVIIPTDSASDFAFSIEDLKKASSNKTKAILIGHPSNPTGASLSRELLEDLVRFANERGLYIISDEIYDRLSYDGDHTCVAGLDGARDRTVVVNGFSKTYAMTGWRLGYALAPRAIIE
ncbi:MAG TPA: aminotransferase class I/II-fold pyridoxal phosphate-dependent enzyme, partial [Candidatus Melainabacteria bacterium]|nr:aminotransferase class I/II-fold pyridoxal phosphate-dependent enzyme [Candidatus Melainabacteria bacterium]